MFNTNIAKLVSPSIHRSFYQKKKLLSNVVFYDTRNSYVIIHQGKEVIQYYIDELISEGVTYLAPFENSHGRPRTKSAEAVSSEDQTEEDGNALPIASSAIEASDVVPLASRPGECKIY